MRLQFCGFRNRLWGLDSYPVSENADLLLSLKEVLKLGFGHWAAVSPASAAPAGGRVQCPRGVGTASRFSPAALSPAVCQGDAEGGVGLEPLSAPRPCPRS